MGGENLGNGGCCPFFLFSVTSKGRRKREAATFPDDIKAAFPGERETDELEYSHPHCNPVQGQHILASVSYFQLIDEDAIAQITLDRIK